MAASDGAETVLSTARADALWVEGDQLLLLGGAAGTQLLSMPVTGGTPALIADGTAGRTVVGIGQLGSHLPTATDFFFAESSRISITDPTTVWRALRTAAPPTEIARFTELQASGDAALHFHGVALAPEGLVLGSDWGVGKVVPLDGGSPRTLAVPAVVNVVTDVDFVAVDARGVYWSARTRRNVEPLAEELVISPVDGGAVRPSGRRCQRSPMSCRAGPTAPVGWCWSAPSVSRMRTTTGRPSGRSTRTRTRASSPAGPPPRTPTSTTRPRQSRPTRSTSWPGWTIRSMQFIRVPRAAP